MITFFTRKELLITMDVGRQMDVRNILAANGIKFAVKVTTLQSANAIDSSRGRVGTLGVNLNYSYEYKIYVHKKDYEQALRLIR